LLAGAINIRLLRSIDLQFSESTDVIMLTILPLLSSRSISSVVLSLGLIISLSGCARRGRDQRLTKPTKANEQQPSPSPQTNAGAFDQRNALRININTALAKELETLPGIGKGLAARIIEHREKWGAFRRPEHLIAVRGISDRRFRALKDLVTVE
jgi:competence ComEA-like helix-hairpin-helix protein